MFEFKPSGCHVYQLIKVWCNDFNSNRMAKNIHLNYVLAYSTCYCVGDIRIVINVYWFIKLIFWFKVIWNRHIAVGQIQNIKGCLFKAVHCQTDSKTLRLASIYKLLKTDS